jgi:Zn-dependent peptidase ImmA (M78 family)
MNQSPKDLAPTASVLKTLRDLMPNRTMSLFEAKQRAEVQAMRFLAMQGIDSPSVPHEIVSELPKVEVAYVGDMPISGSTHWEHGRWIIRLNEHDHPTRQRFSMMHEYKHVLDHPFGEYIAERVLSGVFEDHTALAERVANYFAGCVLMPKSWLKTAFFSQTQDVTVLARMFNVSPKAMHFRLNELGLTSKDRCLPIASIAVSGLSYGVKHRKQLAARSQRTAGRARLGTRASKTNLMVTVFGKRRLPGLPSEKQITKQILQGVSP